MKTQVKLFGLMLSVIALQACVSAESELLRKARIIQDEMLASATSLDSSLNVKIQSMNSQLSELAQDSTMSTDSLKLQNFMQAKQKADNLAAIQSEITDWRSNLKLLPDVKAIEGGAENPFGEKAKDQEILGEIKKSQETFNQFKLKAEAAMK